MIKNIKSRLIKKLWGIESIEINFNRGENQQVISEIEKSLFRPGEIKSNGTSSFSVLTRRTLAQFLGQKYWITSEEVYIIRCLLSIFFLPFRILLPLIRGMVKLRASTEINRKTPGFNKIFKQKSSFI